jgi:DNA-binding transcriptional LysR family regulator
MNIKQLQHFICVYDNSSLTGAAQALGVTQSNISKSIQKLEDELELLLFHRHTRHVQATDAAEKLYRNARQCLTATDDFINKARYLSHGESGTLKIGCGPLAHDLLLKPLINHLVTKESKISIHAGTGSFNELKHQLDNHIYDCLFYDVGELEQIADPSDYQVIPLLQKQVHIVANEDHPIHLQQDVLDNLFDYRWVLPPIPQRYIGLLPTKFQEFLLNSELPDFEVTDLPQALDLAEANNLITIAVGNLTDKTFLRRSLKPIKVPFTIMSDIGLWRLRSRYLTPTNRDLISTLESICDV